MNRRNSLPVGGTPGSNYLTASDDIPPQEASGRTSFLLLDFKDVPDLTGQVSFLDNSNSVDLKTFGIWKGLMNNDLDVSLKIVKRSQDDESDRRRIIKEITVWASLSHRNISEFRGRSTIGISSFVMVSLWYKHGTSQEYLRNYPDLVLDERM